MGNMRRLPPWMLAGESAGKTATINRTEDKRKHEPEAAKTKAEKRPRRIVKSKERDDDSDESKKVKNRRREGERVRIKNEEEDDDDDLTVDDLLSFAHEYVKSEEDQRRKERESLLISESMVVMNESNMRSSQGEEETNGSRRDSTADDICVPSKSTATIKLELLPLTDGIITLDTLQIHVKEKGRRYIPEQSLKINAMSSISSGVL